MLSRPRSRAGPALVALMTVAMLLFGGGVVPSPPALSATPTTFTPAADTWVSSQSPSTNYGTGERLSVDRSPAAHIYLRFNVTEIAGLVESATLRLYVVNASTGSGGRVATTSDTAWSEGSLTWANRPAVDGPTLDSAGPAARSTWVELDVTNAIGGNGAVSFVIQSDSVDGAEYSSREAGSRPLELVVTQGEGELPAGIPLPGPFEAEDYRDGGPGVGYHDTTPGNAGKRYRQDDVDIQTCDDAESGSPCHNVGWIRGGEWLAYDVTVAEGGEFALSLRTATLQSNRFARVEVNGAQAGPSIPIPNTGSFNAWTTTAPITIPLEAGNQTLRIVAETSSFNLNWISVSAVATGDEDVVLVGAGDIASCLNDGDEATASLLDDIQGTVFTTGDNAYPDGTAENFADCYEPSWGHHKARTRPAVGNHEYIVPDASAYFDYFGTAAGEPAKGWYSYDLGEWHVVVLNSNCSKSGGCDADDPQAVWLAADLAADTSDCTVAYWHHPRYSSGHHGSDANMQTFWEIAFDAGVELVINGHEHAYERFAPLNASGNLDRESGIRQIVAGTGGGSHHEMGDPIPNSEASNDDTFGVLKLTLSTGSYAWEFIPIAGSTFTDSGSDSCH